jgi:hypothetical protein
LYSSFDIPVIPLNQIVQTLTLPDADGFIFFLNGMEHITSDQVASISLPLQLVQLNAGLLSESSLCEPPR